MCSSMDALFVRAARSWPWSSKPGATAGSKKMPGRPNRRERKVMIAATSKRDGYRSAFAQFEDRLAKNEPGSLRRLRRRALDRFIELGLPSSRDEEWRFTNLSPLTKIEF